MFDSAHSEGGKLLLDVSGIAFRTPHGLVAEDELLKIFPATVASVFKNRHVSSGYYFSTADNR